MLASFIVTYLLFGLVWAGYATYSGRMKEEDTLVLTVIHMFKHIAFWFIFFSFMTFENFVGKK